MIYFSTKAAATAAMKSIEPHVEVKDRKLYPEWPLPKGQSKAFVNSRCLHLNNIPEDLTNDDLVAKLEKYGTVVRIVFARSLKAAKRKDYAFVEFSHKNEANAAMEREKNLEFAGKKVELSKAKDRDDRRERERFGPPGRFPHGGRGAPPGRGFMRGAPPGYGGPGRGPPPPRGRSRSNERLGGDPYERRKRDRDDFDREDRGRPGGPKRRGFDAPPPLGPEPRGPPPPYRGERDYAPLAGPRDPWGARPEPRRDAGPPPPR